MSANSHNRTIAVLAVFGLVFSGITFIGTSDESAAENVSATLYIVPLGNEQASTWDQVQTFPSALSKTYVCNYGSTVNIDIWPSAGPGFNGAAFSFTQTNTSSGLSLSTTMEKTSPMGTGTKVLHITGTALDNTSVRVYNKTSMTGSYEAFINFNVTMPSYTHTVTYSANGGNGSTESTVVTDSNNGNTDVTLADSGFSRAGYNFAGWKIGNTIYQPGQFVPVAADTSVSAVAQWTPIPVTITSSAEQADIVVGDSFVRMITTDPSGATLSVSGVSWVTLSGSTLVGTPTQAGDYTVTVTASNESSSDSQTIVIHVVNRLAFESVPTGGILATPVI